MATRFIVVITMLNQHCVFHVGNSKAVEKRALKSHRVSSCQNKSLKLKEKKTLRPSFFTVISHMHNAKGIYAARYIVAV